MKRLKLSSILFTFSLILFPFLIPPHILAVECCSIYYSTPFTNGEMKPMKMVRVNGVNKCIVDECNRGLGTNIGDIGVCAGIRIQLSGVTGASWDPFNDNVDSNCRTPNLAANDPGQTCSIFTNQCIDLPPPISYSTDCVDQNTGAPVPGIRTAIGCIKTTPGGFISQVLAVGISIGSGLAFLYLIYGSYKFMTSQGSPEGINQGKDIITSAIAGLVFIILSVSILFIVGIDILGLQALGLGGR